MQSVAASVRPMMQAHLSVAGRQSLGSCSPVPSSSPLRCKASLPGRHMGTWTGGAAVSMVRPPQAVSVPARPPSATAAATAAPVSQPPPVASAMSVLKQFWGYDAFRLCQEEVIMRTLAKGDSLVVMGTGAGKSMCYQVPPLVLGSTSIVISPLISLMEDQVMALKARGIRACFLGSAQMNYQVKEAAFQGAYSIVYMTPELAAVSAASLQALHRLKPICLVAIDEAHCVSEWGHDFRPEYRQLGALRAVLPGVPFLALTATATERVQDDIVRNLSMPDAERRVESFERRNLRFEVASKLGGIKEVFADLVEEKTASRDSATLIYTLTPGEADKIADFLELQGLEGRVAVYHGKMTFEARHRAHAAFLRDDCDIMVATIAYGMGIDKPNVRKIMHYGLPASMEAYYQQAGRAGRDGQPASCTMYWSHADLGLQEMIKDSASLSEEGRKQSQDSLTKVQAYCSSTSCRSALLVNHFVPPHERLSLQGPCCGGCDNCTTRDTGALVIRDVGAEARLLLSAVQGMGGFFGLGKPILLLRGSKNKTIPVGAMDLCDPEGFPLHGSGKGRSEAWWKAMAGLLVSQGLLQYQSNAAKQEGGMPFSSINVTLAGADLLSELPAPLVMELPEAMTSEERRAREVAEEEARAAAERAAGGAEHSPSASAAKREEERELLRVLVQRRKEVADSLSIVPTTLVNEETLVLIQQRRPGNVEQMQEIGAMAPDAVFSKFGLPLLDAVVTFCGTAAYLRLGTEPKAPRRSNAPPPPVAEGFAVSGTIAGVRTLSSEEVAAALRAVSEEPKGAAFLALSRFQAGESVVDIAELREKPIKPDTVVGYLSACLSRAHTLDCDRLIAEAGLSEALALQVADAVVLRAESPAGEGPSLKDLLGPDVTYIHIKLVAALMVARAAWFNGSK